MNKHIKIIDAIKKAFRHQLGCPDCKKVHFKGVRTIVSVLIFPIFFPITVYCFYYYGEEVINSSVNRANAFKRAGLSTREALKEASKYIK